MNIPEFVNIAEDGLLKIDVPAAESYQLFDHASELERKGQLTEALTEWKRAMQTDPEDEGARNGLALCQAKNGLYEEALTSFQKATELNPKFVDAYFNWGELLAQMGRPGEAIAEWQKAVEVTPDYAKAHDSMGNVYFQMGMIPEAVAHWRKAISIGSKSLPTLNRAAWVLATSPDSSVRNGVEAVAFAERAVGLPGGEKPEILDTLAAAYAEAGRFTSAVKTARRALVLATQQNNQALVVGLKSRMVLYEGETPFRDTTQPSTPRMPQQN